MTQPEPSRQSTPAEDHAFRGLEPGAESLPAGVLLGDIPWEGPLLDPETLNARSLLSWIR